MSDLRLRDEDTKKLTHAGRGMIAGLVIGSALGVVIGATVHNWDFLAILVGPGGFVGLCLGAMKDRAQRERDEGRDAGAGRPG